MATTSSVHCSLASSSPPTCQSGWHLDALTILVRIYLAWPWKGKGDNFPGHRVSWVNGSYSLTVEAHDRKDTPVFFLGPFLSNSKTSRAMLGALCKSTQLPLLTILEVRDS